MVAEGAAYRIHDVARHEADQVLARRLVGEDEIDVVPQIAADTRQMNDGWDAHGAQRLPIADTREQEQLRRLQRAGGEDHLAPRVHRPHRASLPVLDPHRPPVLEHYARRVRPRAHREVGPVAVRLEIGSCCTPALAVLLRQLIEPHTFLLRAVEVRVAFHPLLLRGREPELRER